MIYKFTTNFSEFNQDELFSKGFTKVWEGKPINSFDQWKSWDAVVGPNENHRTALIQTREGCMGTVQIWVSNSLINWFRVHESGEYHPIGSEWDDPEKREFVRSIKRSAGY